MNGSNGCPPRRSVSSLPAFAPSAWSSTTSSVASGVWSRTCLPKTARWSCTDVVDADFRYLAFVPHPHPAVLPYERPELDEWPGLPDAPEENTMAKFPHEQGKHPHEGGTHQHEEGLDDGGSTDMMTDPNTCKGTGRKHQFGMSGVCAMCGVKSGGMGR